MVLDEWHKHPSLTGSFCQGAVVYILSRQVDLFPKRQVELRPDPQQEPAGLVEQIKEQLARAQAVTEVDLAKYKRTSWKGYVVYTPIPIEGFVGVGGDHLT
eukprot:COSAG01_NODE_16464_length_1235_cov_1.120599_1_plen_100_part_10